jgi:hypothetical protein
MNLPDFVGLGILVIYLGALVFGMFGLLERKAQEIQVEPEPEETEELKLD